MSLGQGNISFGNNPPPAATPGPTGAENGVSLNGSNVVLGSDPGDPAGQLLNYREIGGAYGIVMPVGKFGVGVTVGTLAGSSQNMMALNDTWTNESAAAAFFCRTLSTPTTNVLINSNIPGSFSVHMVLSNGSYSGGPGSVIAAVKGNIVTQDCNPGMQTTQQVNGLVAGFLPWGVQNLYRVALMRAQSPDPSISPTGVIVDIVGFLVEDMNTLPTVTVGNRYGAKQEGQTDINQWAGPMVMIDNGEVLNSDPQSAALNVKGSSRPLAMYVEDDSGIPRFIVWASGQVLVNTGSVNPALTETGIEIGEGKLLRNGQWTEAQRLAVVLGDNNYNGSIIYQTDGVSSSPGFYGIVDGAWHQFNTTPV